MSSVVISGDTSGAITLQAPAVSGNTTLTLPTTTGTVVVANGAQTIEFADGSASAPSITNSGDTNTGMFFPAADTIAFADGGVESMRIDSSGNVLVGATSQFAGFVANAKLYTESSTADYITHFRNTNGTAANAFGLALSYSTTPNGTSNAFLDARDSTAQRAAIRSNGGLANYSANNVNLSDGRLKTDITPAKSYLDTICSIPVVTFKYNDQTDDELNLGVIAQDVDAVAPELIDHSGFGEAPEGESPYLAVYQTDLQYALMKCIQELKAIVDEQAEKIKALEAK